MKFTIRTLLLAISLATFSLFSSVGFAAEEGYYKWTDEKGQPHLSDRLPPSGTTYEFVAKDGSMRRHVSTEEAKVSATPKPVAPPPPKEPISEDAGAVVKNPAYCDQAKANLDTLNSKARVRIRDADGNIRFLTEEEKEPQRQKARDLIDVHCAT
jgi:hypothetical protein